MRRRVRKTETQSDASALARVRFRPCQVKDIAEVIGFWNEFGAPTASRTSPRRCAGD